MSISIRVGLCLYEKKEAKLSASEVDEMGVDKGDADL